MIKSKETEAEKTARLRALRLEREALYKKTERTSDYPVLDLDLESEMPFGKHKGKLLSTVIEDDPGWLIWALENIKDFEISAKAEAELDLVQDVRRPPKAWE